MQSGLQRWASRVVLVVKILPANAGDARDTGSIPGLGRSPGGGHGNPLQYLCLENPMDRGAWWAIVHRVAKSWTQLKQLSTHTYRGYNISISSSSLSIQKYLFQCVLGGQTTEEHSQGMVTWVKILSLAVCANRMNWLKIFLINLLDIKACNCHLELFAEAFHTVVHLLKSKIRRCIF